jgi:hypothetical protein
MISQLYYDKSHMATCFDFQEVIFRPFELIAFWPIVSTYEMLDRYGIPYGFRTDIQIKVFL